MKAYLWREGLVKLLLKDGYEYVPSNERLAPFIEQLPEDDQAYALGQLAHEAGRSGLAYALEEAWAAQRVPHAMQH